MKLYRNVHHIYNYLCVALLLMELLSKMRKMRTITPSDAIESAFIIEFHVGLKVKVPHNVLDRHKIQRYYCLLRSYKKGCFPLLFYVAIFRCRIQIWSQFHLVAHSFWVIKTMYQIGMKLYHIMYKFQTHAINPGSDMSSSPGWGQKKGRSWPGLGPRSIYEKCLFSNTEVFA